MSTSSNSAITRDSQQTNLSEPSRDAVISGLHGSSDLVALALGLEDLQKSLTNGSDRPRFELRSELGVGGQGIVLSVYDRDCGRTQALKVLHEHRGDRDGVARFIHEAQVMAQLEHPGVVPIHDLNVLEDGTLYYSMKRIEGDSLADMIASLVNREKRFEALQIFLKICDTMNFAHDKGVIHRDLKPANIMVGAYGEVLVVDWGLAKTLDSSEVISPRDANDSGDAFATRMGLAVGTPSYMSPEQARGESEDVDHCSDIFALGVILYELLVGKSPYFPQTKARPVMETAARGKWLPIDKVDEIAIPPALRAIVIKAMAYEKKDRYQKVSAFAADLRSFIAGQAVSAYRETLLEIIVRCCRRHKTPLLAVMVTVILGGLVSLGIWLRDQHLINERIEDLRTTASLAVAEKDYAGAVASYQRLLELQPEDDKAAENVGRYGALAENLVRERGAAQTREGNRLRAIELADNAEALIQREVNLNNAIEDLTQALALVPADSVEVQQRFLPLRDQALRKIAAQEEREQRLQAAALISQAEQLVSAEDWIEARVALQQALQLVPSNSQTSALSQRIETGLASYQERQQRVAAQRLLDQAAAQRSNGQFDKAIANVQAALALGVIESAPELLTELVREQDQQVARLERERLLADADGEISAIDKSLAANDLIVARHHFGRLTALQEDSPELSRLRDLSAIRLRIDQAMVTNQHNKAMEQVGLARGKLGQAGQISEEAADLQGSLETTEEQLQQRPGEPRLREKAHALARRLDQLLAQQSQALGEAISHLNQALAIAPDYAPVRSVLAEFWAQRVVELERAGDAPAAAAAAAQGKHYDAANKHRLVFEGLAVVEVASAYPLQLQRLETKANRRDEAVGEILTLEPGKSREIPHGRWLIEDGEGLILARNFQRGSTYELNFKQPSNKVAEDLIYIPPTPLYKYGSVERSVMGQGMKQSEVPGFFMGRYELTCEEYLEFLNDPETLRTLKKHDENTPMILLPRPSWDSKRSFWTFADGKYQLLNNLSETRLEINGRWPVTGISRLDVDAYLAWRSKRDGVRWRLPSGEEWQAAVQGGDGRLHPWGSLPDNAMCYSYAASPTTTGQVEKPVGSFPGDQSVQGVFDLAGSVAEFVDESWYGRKGVSVARGGSFVDRDAQRFTFASRRAVDNRLPVNSVGFRLALDAP